MSAKADWSSYVKPALDIQNWHKVYETVTKGIKNADKTMSDLVYKAYPSQGGFHCTNLLRSIPFILASNALPAQYNTTGNAIGAILAGACVWISTEENHNSQGTVDLLNSVATAYFINLIKNGSHSAFSIPANLLLSGVYFGLATYVQKNKAKEDAPAVSALPGTGKKDS